MKKLLILILCLITFRVEAQISVGTPEEVAAFYKTKTMVVLDPNELKSAVYNAELKKAVAERWKLTEYEFISYEEFKKNRKNKAYSFLIMNEVRFPEDDIKPSYYFLQLLLGGDYVGVAKMPLLCAVPLTYADIENENYTYKIATLIQFIQNHVELSKSNPKLTAKNIMRHYEKNTPSIKGKTLYIVEEDLPKGIDYKKVYSGEVKVVSQDDLAKVLENKDEKAVFVHKMGPENSKKKARCYKMIFGAADANLYYFDYHWIDAKNPDGFLEKDFKKIKN